MSEGGSASWGSMLVGQVHYANRGFWRTPIAAFFTIVFPLAFLVILCSIYGNEVIDPDNGLRLAQYTTPVFAVFGVCMACMVSLALAVSYARAAGVLKRLRGTPLPTSVYVAGRVGSALWISMITTVVLVGVGVAFYGVQIIWTNVPALVLTFGVGIACFCAVGLAIAALAPTPSAAQAISNGGLILLSFISGIFGFAELPTWMERVALFFPLKHFVDPIAAGFNPYLDASTPAWGDLGMMAAWGIAAALVVRSTFGWDPTPGRGAKPKAKPAAESGAEPGAESGAESVSEVTAALVGGGGTAQAGSLAAVPAAATAPSVATAPAADSTAPAVISTGRPGLPTMIGAQTRYAVQQTLRDPASVFFAIVFPVLLVTFFTLIYGPEVEWGGLPLPQYLAAAFAVYGVATMAFVNLPGTISEQRGNRVLKRIRGTPLPSWCYLAARILAALVLGVTTVVLVFAVAVAFLGVTLPPSTWAATLLTFTLAIVCFAACGLALVAVVDGPQAVIAVGLCVLLPLSFISDIFISTPTLPTVLNAVGWTFPLRHAVHAAVMATSGGALDGAFWLDLGVLLLWTAIGLLAAWRLFHWEPRASRARRAAHAR